MRGCSEPGRGLLLKVCLLLRGIRSHRWILRLGVLVVCGGSEIRICLPMQETRVQSLGQEDHLEKEMATHSSILAWRIPWTESLVGYSSWGHKELDTI